MALLNYTTTISTARSSQEITALLAKAGAKAIMQEFDDNGEVSALAFKMNVQGAEAAFKLPTDWRPVQKVLVRQRKPSSPEQSARVAWRITKTWIEAQLAIIETGMVEPEEVLLPYMITPGGRTAYEAFKDDPRFLLGGGAS